MRGLITMKMHYEYMVVLADGFKCALCGAPFVNYAQAKDHRRLCSRKQQNI